MTVSLQQFEHGESVYERPDQRWVCGRARDGEACRFGPDRRGRCGATAECKPSRQGDRWVCTRTAAGLPSRCPDGPRPDGTCCRPITRCQPIRSLRARRGRLAWACVAMTLAVLVALAGGPWSARFLSPGPLAMNHAELDADCGRCHTAGGGSFGAMLAKSFTPPDRVAESANCLRCHALGPTPTSPHGLPRATLDVLMAEASAASGNGSPSPAPAIMRIALARMVTGNPAESDAVACATCHVEHQGRRFELTRMDPVRCQSCHQQPFHSFVDGHPEFSPAYPSRRRPRIAFNHATHLASHFAAEGWEGNCMSCHEPDASHEHMLVKPFEVTCGSCHHHRDHLRSVEPVTVFGLPGVDVGTLTTSGVWIGDTPWAADANDGYEMPLTGFMKLLLATDDATAADLARFEDPDLLLDLSAADDDDLAAAGRIVWAVKDLVNTLTEGGRDELESRLRAALGSLTPVEIDALLGEPRDRPQASTDAWLVSLRGMRDEYMPDLAEEVSLYRADPSRVITAGFGRSPEPETPAPAPDPPAADTSPDDEDLFGDEDDLFGDDDDEDDLFGDDEPLLGQEEPALPASPPSPSVDDLAAELEAIRERIWLDSGWHLDRDLRAVVYRPAGHADPLLHAWFDHTADTSETRPSALASADGLFAQLRALPDSGRCVRCHSVDEVDGIHRVNWHANRASVGDRGFTRFDHGPHFNFIRFRNCVTCHVVEEIDRPRKSLWQATYDGTDPHRFEPTLGAITKSMCIECHTPTGAGDRCLSCHNYHVGSFRPVLAPPGLGASAGRP